MNNNYYFTPWESKLLDSIKHVKQQIILVAPFIKYSTIKKIVSNIPKNKNIKLILISRFTKQVFLQKSSDLDMFNYLLNFEFNNINCECYMQNNLHSKIYILDNTTMFITSSNLSYSGLISNHEIAVEINNSDEIEHIQNKLKDLMLQKKMITDDMLYDMSQNLNHDMFELFRTNTLISDNIETNSDICDSEECIIERITRNEEQKSLNLLDQLNYNDTLNKANQFNQKNQRLILNILDNKEFKSIDNTSLYSEELEQVAQNDYNKLKKHIINVFSKVFDLESNTYFLDDLIGCFIHSTWQSKFRNVNIRTTSAKKRLFETTGKLLFWLIVEKNIFDFKSYKFSTTQEFHSLSEYIKNNYAFFDVLKSIKCNILFYSNNVKIQFIESLFYELLGVIYYHFGYDMLIQTFNKSFNVLDEYLDDEYFDINYKTLLQELTQQKFGLPEYRLVIEKGEDHLKTFEYAVYLNNEFLGKGIGYSKKNAQESAAEVAMKNYLKLYDSNVLLKNPKNLKTYNLPKNRIESLTELNFKLGIKVSNLALLDIALTHISWVNKNLYSRDNSKLAYLGSQIEMTLRTTSIIFNSKELDDKVLDNYLEKIKNTKVSDALEKYFNILNLQDYLQIGMDNAPISFKVSVIQSLICICFIEKGYEETESYVENIWNNYNQKEKIYIDYVGKLQEYMQNKYKDSKIEYRIINEKGLDHDKVFVVACFINNLKFGEATAKNKKEARRLAAENVFSNKQFKLKYI